MCSGTTLPDGALVHDNIYNDSQRCRGHVTLAVSKQESGAADYSCISLCSADNRQLSLDRKSSYSIGRITDHPQSSWISWIHLNQSINHGDVDLPEDGTPRDEVTQLKAVDGGRHDSLGEQERKEADVHVTDYLTSQFGEISSETDSGASSLMKQLTMLSRKEDGICDNRSLKSEIHCVVMLDGRPRELTDIIDSTEDDDTQLKLQDGEHSTSRLSARTPSPISVISV